MMRLWPLMLMMPVAACVSATPPAPPARNGDAFCDSIMPDLDRHSEALVEEGSDRVVLTGQVLVAKTDTFCQ